MKVSVIIPVYNVKPYLERCVRSVLGQTYNDQEIIIVDDGSTDGSAELCDELALTDNRIVVIHQKNQGLSGARNTGIRHATGEYVIFLDSDDAWLVDNGLEQLMQGNNQEKDLIVFKNIDFWEEGRSTRTNDYDVEFLNWLPDAQSVFSHLVQKQQLCISACFLLVRRQILIDHGISFPEGVISEDFTWSLFLWQHISSVTFVNLAFYGYYHRNDSITTTIANTLYAYQSYDSIFSYWKEQCNKACVNAFSIRILMADMWVSRGYNYYKLQSTEKQKALTILKRHIDLLSYAETPKSKRTAKMIPFLGVENTVNILSLYWRLRMIVIRHLIK